MEDEEKKMRFKRTCVDGKQVISNQDCLIYGAILTYDPAIDLDQEVHERRLSLLDQ